MKTESKTTKMVAETLYATLSAKEEAAFTAWQTARTAALADMTAAGRSAKLDIADSLSDAWTAARARMQVAGRAIARCKSVEVREDGEGV